MELGFIDFLVCIPQNRDELTYVVNSGIGLQSNESRQHAAFSVEHLTLIN